MILAQKVTFSWGVFHDYCDSYTSTSTDWNLSNLRIRLDIYIDCYKLRFECTLLIRCFCCAVYFTIPMYNVSAYMPLNLIKLICELFIKNYIDSFSFVHLTKALCSVFGTNLWSFMSIRHLWDEIALYIKNVKYLLEIFWLIVFLCSLNRRCCDAILFCDEH